MINVGNGASWSPRNLRLMRQLVDEYSNVKQVASEVEIVQRTVAQIPDVYMKRQFFIKYPIFQTLSGIFDRLTWSHFCELL